MVLGLIENKLGLCCASAAATVIYECRTGHIYSDVIYECRTGHIYSDPSGGGYDNESITMAAMVHYVTVVLGCITGLVI